MQNKRQLYLGIMVSIVVLVIITVILLNVKPTSNEYVFWDSADQAVCEAKKLDLTSKGWTCYTCTDSDNDGKYSLYCDPPVCKTECSLGQTSCNGLVQFKCVSSGCSFLWEQSTLTNNGMIKGKCGVECLTVGDCQSGQTCESYKCKGDVPIDLCKDIVCPSSYCSGATYNYGGTCSNGDCVYSQVLCQAQEICVEGQGCKYTSQCSNATKCPEGNECVSGSCSPIEGYCKVDEACEEGFYCNLDKNKCEKVNNILPIIAVSGTLLLGSIVVLLAKRKVRR